MEKNDEKGRLLQAAPLRIGISTRALFDLEEEHAKVQGLTSSSGFSD
jgi:hypothetical protein